MTTILFTIDGIFGAQNCMPVFTTVTTHTINESCSVLGHNAISC
jgi:hypothetical protein